jgi:hypothetical protein
MFDVENTVNRWVKTEHRRYREQVPNEAHAPTRYLKVVNYHFSSLDPEHQGCAAHGSNDALAASAGLQRLLDFREAVENSFCCGASVDLLLIGLDTDTDAIRVHVPDRAGHLQLDRWLCGRALYESTVPLTASQARDAVTAAVETHQAEAPDPGMVRFISQMLINNFSQQDYVRALHGGAYPDAGHAERFIGVGIGFKEVHLRNLTYFAHLDTVEEGAPDLDVGVKIFNGLNVSRDLPIPVVVRFDYSGKVPGARERAISDCRRVHGAIAERYGDLMQDGLLHTFLTIRDRDDATPAEPVGSSLDPVQQGSSRSSSRSFPPIGSRISSTNISRWCRTAARRRWLSMPLAPNPATGSSVSAVLQLERRPVASRIPAISPSLASSITGNRIRPSHPLLQRRVHLRRRRPRPLGEAWPDGNHAGEGNPGVHLSGGGARPYAPAHSSEQQRQAAGGCGSRWRP